MPPKRQPGGSAAPSPVQRLDVLDGLRGVAALLVVIYHVFARWAEPLWPETLYPHGNLLQHAPWIAVFGHVGVRLFFLISGFVILMTLERSSGIVDFTGRRIARLWPAMLVCATLSALLINASDIAGYFGVARWHVLPAEYFWSVIFVPPDLGQKLLGLDDSGVQWVEGVYWTLWHEVRFYALVAIMFLISPRTWFLWVWLGIQAMSTGLEVLGAVSGRTHPLGFAPDLILQPKMLAWFSLGICGYAFWSGRRGPALMAIILLAFVAIAADNIREIYLHSLSAIGLQLCSYAGIFGVFALFLIRSPLLSPFAARPVVAVGLASYPLYLFHERPSFVIMQLGMEWGLPPLPVAMAAIALLVGIALLLHRIVEMPGKRLIAGFFRRALSKAEARHTWLQY